MSLSWYICVFCPDENISASKSNIRYWFSGAEICVFVSRSSVWRSVADVLGSFKVTPSWTQSHLLWPNTVGEEKEPFQRISLWFSLSSVSWTENVVSHSLPCFEILSPYQGSFISHVSSNYPRLLCYSHPINATLSQHGPPHLPSLPLPTRCFFFKRSSRLTAVLPSTVKNSSQSVGSVRLPGSLVLLV